MLKRLFFLSLLSAALAAEPTLLTQHESDGTHKLRFDGFAPGMRFRLIQQTMTGEEAYLGWVKEDDSGQLCFCVDGQEIPLHKVSFSPTGFAFGEKVTYIAIAKDRTYEIAHTFVPRPLSAQNSLEERIELQQLNPNGKVWQLKGSGFDAGKSVIYDAVTTTETFAGTVVTDASGCFEKQFVPTNSTLPFGWTRITVDSGRGSAFTLSYPWGEEAVVEASKKAKALERPAKPLQSQLVSGEHKLVIPVFSDSIETRAAPQKQATVAPQPKTAAPSIREALSARPQTASQQSSPLLVAAPLPPTTFTPAPKGSPAPDATRLIRQSAHQESMRLQQEKTRQDLLRSQQARAHQALLRFQQAKARQELLRSQQAKAAARQKQALAQKQASQQRAKPIQASQQWKMMVAAPKAAAPAQAPKPNHPSAIDLALKSAAKERAQTARPAAAPKAAAPAQAPRAVAPAQAPKPNHPSAIDLALKSAAKERTQAARPAAAPAQTPKAAAPAQAPKPNHPSAIDLALKSAAKERTQAARPAAAPAQTPKAAAPAQAPKPNHPSAIDLALKSAAKERTQAARPAAAPKAAAPAQAPRAVAPAQAPKPNQPSAIDLALKSAAKERAQAARPAAAPKPVTPVAQAPKAAAPAQAPRAVAPAQAPKPNQPSAIDLALKSAAKERAQAARPAAAPKPVTPVAQAPNKAAAPAQAPRAVAPAQAPKPNHPSAIDLALKSAAKERAAKPVQQAKAAPVAPKTVATPAPKKELNSAVDLIFGDSDSAAFAKGRAPTPDNEPVARKVQTAPAPKVAPTSKAAATPKAVQAPKVVPQSPNAIDLALKSAANESKASGKKAARRAEPTKAAPPALIERKADAISEAQAQDIARKKAVEALKAETAARVAKARELTGRAPPAQKADTGASQKVVGPNAIDIALGRVPTAKR